MNWYKILEIDMRVCVTENMLTLTALENSVAFCTSGNDDNLADQID